MSPGFALSTIFEPNMSNNIVTQKDNNLVKSINYLINKSLQIGSASIKFGETDLREFIRVEPNSKFLRSKYS